MVFILMIVSDLCLGFGWCYFCVKCVAEFAVREEERKCRLSNLSRNVLSLRAHFVLRLLVTLALK